jgi:hypothetical protein
VDLCDDHFSSSTHAKASSYQLFVKKNLNGADPTVNRPFHEGDMVMMRLKDWQDYHGNACHVEGS